MRTSCSRALARRPPPSWPPSPTVVRARRPSSPPCRTPPSCSLSRAAVALPPSFSKARATRRWGSSSEDRRPLHRKMPLHPPQRRPRRAATPLPCRPPRTARTQPPRRQPRRRQRRPPLITMSPGHARSPRRPPSRECPSRSATPHETKAPETKAPETKAPKTKAPNQRRSVRSRSKPLLRLSRCLRTSTPRRLRTGKTFTWAKSRRARSSLHTRANTSPSSSRVALRRRR